MRKKNTAETKSTQKGYPRTNTNTRNKIIIYNTTVNNFKKSEPLSEHQKLLKNKQNPITGRQSMNLAQPVLQKSQTALHLGTRYVTVAGGLKPPADQMYLTVKANKVRNNASSGNSMLVPKNSDLRNSSGMESDAPSFSYRTSEIPMIERNNLLLHENINDIAGSARLQYASSQIISKSDTKCKKETPLTSEGESLTKIVKNTQGNSNRKASISSENNISKNIRTHQANIKVVARIRPPNKLEYVFFSILCVFH